MATQQTERWIEQLNHPDKDQRLEALKALQPNADQHKAETNSAYVNNHIHTTFSFSPYSPTKAVWQAYQAGLNTSGIMDHDTIAGAREFIEAGKILGMATTIGVECRADFSTTPMGDRRLNNPDQEAVAYLALHGIPHTQIDTVQDFFAPYIEERNVRNAAMVERINKLLGPHGIHLDFEADVVPLSQYHAGGSITERHISFALAHKLMAAFGKGEKLTQFLQDDLQLSIGDKILGLLLDPDNELYDYDLLGAIKSSLVEHFYIPADAECPTVQQVLALSQEVGSIACYAYLGDVGDSVTGDKKAQKFEDDFLDELLVMLKDLGFNAITYMPARNTLEQLLRLKKLCAEQDLFEISGEDINSPRQSFICEALTRPEFQNLIDSTWALIGHELAATDNLDDAMFSPKTAAAYPDLAERIQRYKQIGLERAGS